VRLPELIQLGSGLYSSSIPPEAGFRACQLRLSAQVHKCWHFWAIWPPHADLCGETRAVVPAGAVKVLACAVEPHSVGVRGIFKSNPRMRLETAAETLIRGLVRNNASREVTCQ
jgi:hypothetical protein